MGSAHARRSSQLRAHPNGLLDNTGDGLQRLGAAHLMLLQRWCLPGPGDGSQGRFRPPACGEGSGSRVDGSAVTRCQCAGSRDRRAHQGVYRGDAARPLAAAAEADQLGPWSSMVRARPSGDRPATGRPGATGRTAAGRQASGCGFEGGSAGGEEGRADGVRQLRHGRRPTPPASSRDRGLAPGVHVTSGVKTGRCNMGRRSRLAQVRRAGAHRPSPPASLVSLGRAAAA
jgi:hypothetical protein